MQETYGQSNGPVILLHGGAGRWRQGTAPLAKATAALCKVAKTSAALLAKNADLKVVATRCLQGMEDDPQFNAGYGCLLQGDGQARLSASLMDGRKQTFSGVVLASYLKNPSALSLELQKRDARVIGPPGTELLAREMGIAVESPQIRERLLSLSKIDVRNSFGGADTVGVVVLDKRGHLVAGTSTGGRGGEFPGRMSDSATVAGNYASRFAAISTTGRGEDIIDDALAARFETRCRDGMEIHEACRKAMREGKAAQRSYGWIAIDGKGNWGACFTTPGMAFAVVDMKGKVLASS